MMVLVAVLARRLILTAHTFLRLGVPLHILSLFIISTLRFVIIIATLQLFNLFINGVNGNFSVGNFRIRGLLDSLINHILLCLLLDELPTRSKLRLKLI